MNSSWIDRTARGAVLRALRGIERGSLTVTWPGGREEIHGAPGPVAQLQVEGDRFFRRALFGGEIGLGESYMDGEWSTPNLVRLVELMIANREVLNTLPGMLSWPSRVRDTIAHVRRGNSRQGSRKNIHDHYDLSNEFFSLFLDRSLMYSCAVFETPGDSLEQAQRAKLASICEQLQLGPDDHVLEIGTGWGGFALHAAAHYGCRVTTTTISPSQHQLATERVHAAGLGDRKSTRLNSSHVSESRMPSSA